ncbi:MAG: hypothetical protein JNN12_14650 [Bacteroidetes Order II. Incertae sedis bacterium]|nr:hypothetical protein [Bacteroidetes Order II. bacterium]
MKKFFFLLFCLCLHLIENHAVAQEGGFALRGPGGVVLAWEGAVLNQTNPIGGFVGYHIYRESPGSDPIRLTDQPLSMPANEAELTQKAGDRVIKWIKAARAKDAEALLRRIQTEDPRTKLLFLYDPFFAEVAGVRYTDRTAKPQQTYTYRVVQVKTDGTESAPIARFQVAAGLPEPPAKPTSIHIVQQGLLPIVQWSPNKTAKAPFYHVYRSTSPDRSWIRVHPNPVIILPRSDDPEPMGIFADSTLALDETVYYGVRAVDLAGNESELTVSPSIRLHPTRHYPLPDSIHTISVGNTIQLRWKNRPENAARGFGILRASLSNPKDLRLLTTQPLAPEMTAFSDPNVQGEDAYLYRILLYDETGAVADTSAQIPAIWENTEILPAPENVAIKVQDEKTLLSWEAVYGAIGYEVFYFAAVGADPIQLSARIPATESMFVLPAHLLRKGEVAGFSVQAINASGKSGQISEPTFYTPNLAPNPPENIEITPVLGGIQLNWQAPYNQFPDRYRIFRSTTDGQWEQIGTVTSGEPLHWLDENPATETRSYAITAVLGPQESPPTQSRTVVATSTPAASLQASGTSKGILLTWTNPEPHTVYRRTGNGLLEKVANTISDGLWLDATVQKGKRYAYVITAATNPNLHSEEVSITFH